MSTHLADNREEALAVGFLAIDWPEPMPVDQYERAFEDWTVRGIVRDGKTIGTTYVKDCELHVAILPEWRKRWVTRNVLNEMFDMPKVIARPIERSDTMYNYLICLGFEDKGDKTLVKEGRSCLPS